MKMYFGTYSDEAIIKRLRSGNHSEDVYIGDKTDEEIKKDIIDKGKIKHCFAYFYAEDVSKAFNQAKDMDLKNFSQVCDTLYEKGKHY